MSDHLQKVITEYCQKWGKSKVLLVGYSFGASVLPNVVNNLEVAVQKKLKALVLLVPGKFATYKVTYASMLNWVSSGDPIIPEIKKINKKIPVLLACNGGDDDVCSELSEEEYPRVLVDSHQLKNKLKEVAKTVYEHFLF